jgi:hypothetical protein
MNARRSSLPAALFVMAAACSHDSSSTGPKPVAGVKCELATGTGVVTLAALQSTTVNCSQGGTVFELAGGGASYLLVPEFATGNVAITTTPFTLGTPNASRMVAPASIAPGLAPPGASALVPLPATGVRSVARQRRFDAVLRAADR